MKVRCGNCGEIFRVDEDDLDNTVCPSCGKKVRVKLPDRSEKEKEEIEELEDFDEMEERKAPSKQAKREAHPPKNQLKTNRGLIKYFFLNLITFSLYSFFTFSAISRDINIIASRYDGKKTSSYALVYYVITPLTLGIGFIVWRHKLSARIGAELERRGIDYKFSAKTFWGWFVLGSLILVGPMVYIAKLFKAMNLLSDDYNTYG